MTRHKIFKQGGDNVSFQMRKSLSAEGMYSLIHQKSLQVPDIRRPGSQTIPMADTVMSAIAGDHKSLFAFIEGSEKLGEVSHMAIHEKGVTHTFCFMNDVSLNDSNKEGNYLTAH